VAPVFLTAAESAMSERTHLPDRRDCELITFESGGMRFTASIGRYPDGRVSELFLDNHKAGSTIGTLVRDMAIVFSFAVQHGADSESIRRALCRDSAGRALGPLGEILDLILENTEWPPCA
jgi:ribonucleoside-diphosphate reductase alpha chain